MKRFIEYKAEWEGIRVIEVDERDTSKTCNKCGSQNTKRIGQGKFVCRDCGLEDNADKNGASNIAKRALGKSIRRPLSEVGALLAVPETPAEKGDAACRIGVRLENPTRFSRGRSQFRKVHSCFINII